MMIRVPAARTTWAAVLLCATLPAAAHAATAAPTVTTGGAARITPTSATLTGKVDPQGHPTSYVFQYGTTTAYGATTPATAVGAGTSAVTAAADVASLAPHTKYHYRLVATSPVGTTRGGDRTFTSAKQPLGLTLGAAPNPVPWGAPVAISGNLSGTGNAGQTIVLRQNPFPFTAGLQPFGNALVTDAAGNFATTLATLGATTQFQALVNGKPVVSPIVTVPVSARVATSVSRTHVRRGARVRFSGVIHPARDGAQVAVQKLSSTKRWVTVAGTITHHVSASMSRYRKTIHVRRGGQYRIFVGIQDGNLTSGVGRTVMLHTHR